MSANKRGGKPKATYVGSRRDVNTVAFSLDGKTLAPAGLGKTIELWDVSVHNPDGKPKVTLEGHAASVFTILFSADGQTFASSS